LKHTPLDAIIDYVVVIFLRSNVVLTPSGQFFDSATIAISEQYVHAVCTFG